MVLRMQKHSSLLSGREKFDRNLLPGAMHMRRAGTDGYPGKPWIWLLAALAGFLMAEQIFMVPFTVKTPEVFLLAGEAGGMNTALASTSLSIFPKFVMLQPFCVP